MHRDLSVREGGGGCIENFSKQNFHLFLAFSFKLIDADQSIHIFIFNYFSAFLSLL